jgi:putative endonuclease
MASSSRRLGDRGEDVATDHLITLGWKVIARNVEFRVGELDIVAEDSQHLVFVEVRSRRGRSGPPPAHTVTFPKQRRLTKAANMVLQRYAGPCSFARFDVIGVDLDTNTVTEHIRGAFDASDY